MGDAALQPIGVFDSGIGGLTVVKALRDLLPEEQIIYLGDTARVPYGSRSAITVERYSLEIANMLMERNAKLVVVACNTVSSIALAPLEQNLPVKVIGVIQPGAQAAIQTTRNKHVGVIGTRATIRSGAYEKALRVLEKNVRVTSRACPLLVPLIEEGLLEDELTDQLIARYLAPMLSEGIDTLVLGCTHYPLLAPAIRRRLSDKVNLVDSAHNCALAVQEMLDRESLRAPAGSSGGLEVALTDAPDHFLRVAKEALALDIGEVELREVLHGAAL
jgi:glutamate racemase